MKHVMVDIETLGTRPGSVVVSIGACVFDENGPGRGHKFHQTIDVFDSLMRGLTIDPGTVEWWREQPIDAQLLACADTVRLHTALEEFADWLAGDKDTYLWAKGPDFDLVLLDAAYRAVGEGIPWSFRNARDVRTVLALREVQVPREGRTRHFALADALYQAEQVAAVYRELGLRLDA